MRTKWNLSLLYKSDTDPKIERDMREIEVLCASFARRYKKVDKYLKKKLLPSVLIEYEKLFAKLNGAKPIYYFWYHTCLNSRDNLAQAKLTQFEGRITRATNQILFFELALGRLPIIVQKRLLQSKKLTLYHYFLKKIFELAKYNLSEPEEKIMNLKSQPAHSLWVSGQEKLINSQIVRHGNKNLPINEALGLFSNLPTLDRRSLYRSINSTLKSISYFAESEINAIYLDKKVNDEVRGYTAPDEAQILGCENDIQAIRKLVETVTKNFKISHRFYKLKQKLLKLPHMEYADRAAGVGHIGAKFNWPESVGLVRSAFSKIGPEFVKILDRFLKDGQIDVYPSVGKHGGGFCAHSITTPTFVLLNHTDNMNALKTFAHEMGHAIHSEFSRNQSLIYQNYTTSAAEVASTLFENFAFDEVFEKLSDSEKIIALHNRINDSIGTIFRQIACYNWELELHEEIRARGSLSKEEIAKLHNKHMAKYLGSAVKLSEDDGYFFVHWSHIRRFFYVYSYAYGELISKAIYRRLQKDPHYIEEVKKFLSAGGSDSPENIFKSIGIDTTKPSFWQEGLRAIGEDITRLEKLVKK